MNLTKFLAIQRRSLFALVYNNFDKFYMKNKFNNFPLYNAQSICLHEMNDFISAGHHIKKHTNFLYVSYTFYFEKMHL